MFALLLLFAAPAALQAPAPPAGMAKPVPDKKVCRMMGAPTGSIIGGKRVCHSAAEWAALSQQDGRGTRAFADHRDQTMPIPAPN